MRFFTVLTASICLCGGLCAGTSEEAPTVFRAGFARVDVTPPVGIFIPGSYGRRIAEGVRDPLEARAIAFDDNHMKAVLIAVDNLHVQNDVIKMAKVEIAARTKINPVAILIHSSHTHTGGETLRKMCPGLGMKPEDMPAITNYVNLLVKRLGDVACAAVDDLAPATLSIGTTELKRHAFIRTYLMKDGKVRTNPGVGNKNIVRPIGTPDETLQLARFVRTEGKPEIDIINFQNHPDVAGGLKISADWVGAARREMERMANGVKCIVLNGAQGDLNHLIVDPRPGEIVSDTYANAQNMGTMVAAAAMMVWGRCDPMPTGRLHSAFEPLYLPANKAAADEIALAKKYLKAHIEGRRSEIPFTGMDYVTAVADASRKVDLENAPDKFVAYVSDLSIGRSLAFAGFPGEPFCDIGRRVRAKSPFGMTMAMCLTNGAIGYFPTDEAHEHAGYEAKTSSYGPGTADALVNGQLTLLNKMIRWRQ